MASENFSPSHISIPSRTFHLFFFHFDSFSPFLSFSLTERMRDVTKLPPRARQKESFDCLLTASIVISDEKGERNAKEKDGEKAGDRGTEKSP